MGLLRRRSDVAPYDADTHLRSDATVEPTAFEQRTERDVVVDRWTPGNVLAALAGAALAVLGIVALTRTEVDSTWYRPVEQVAGIDHTPLLAAIEIGVGALLVILALAGSRSLLAFVCLAVAIAAAVAAVDPELVDRELAIDRSWAIVLAASAGALAVLSMLPWPERVERRSSVAGHRGYGRTIEQH